MAYYLCFKINKVPDLTMIKYSVYDISGQEDLLEKHSVFLRQLHRLGVDSGVYFHLLYFYDGSDEIPRGKRLQIIFYATADNPRKLELIREFVTTSVLSTYYDFYCYEISNSLSFDLRDGYIRYNNISGTHRNYKVSSSIKPEDYDEIRNQIMEDQYLYCTIEPKTNEVTEINSQSFFLDRIGRICCGYEFEYGAYLTKKDYHLYAQNTLYTDAPNTLVPVYSIMEWIPNENGRLYNVLKLMEGYNETAALRIDIFPTDEAESFTEAMAPITMDLRKRMAQHDQGRDDNCELILKSIEEQNKKLMKFPHFDANIVAFSDHRDIAVMLADSVGAEAVESGSYLVKDLFYDEENPEGFSVYSFDTVTIADPEEKRDPENYIAGYKTLYTLDEIRPLFSFPVLYPGETIECMKETDPEFDERSNRNLYLGESSTGYSVNFPVKLYKKHAFIAGVPGAGKTNTLLYMVSELWNKFGIPFLVLEPAKQEYRALAKASKLPGMEALKQVCIFSPGADTRFPLHINPFEFPIGLTLAEHIANLNAVFAGAFELPPPSPHFIDTCIEKVYIEKGWNINSRNTGALPYPTMQDLYDSLEIAVSESHYQGETLGNLRSVMEVRVGSLLKREIGSVYNVRNSSFKPEEWLDRPVIIELEALGEGPANFMALLISTLIRETLKVRKTSNKMTSKYGVNHVIFYEEAHNLVGPTQDTSGDKVDPKVSATKFLVKMLAEVRALDEGIVIADQLPTVMAPEVLKNTGLKIGHRITANDDRELLGSTMSATPDQLAEQSIYMPGEALVFYEGLLKPFKMKLSKWQDDEDLLLFKSIMESEGQGELWKDEGSMYDSPTNEGLYALIKDYDVYKELLHQSMVIIIQRVKTLFETEMQRIQKLNKTFLKSAYNERVSIALDTDRMKKALDKHQADYAKRKADIIVRERDLTNTKSKYQEAYKIVRGTLRLMFQNCNSLFLNNISIAPNYDVDSNTMAYLIISMYLEVLNSLEIGLLPDNELLELILSSSEAIRDEIRRYVDLDNQTGILIETEYYSELCEKLEVFERVKINADFSALKKDLLNAIDWQSQTCDTETLCLVCRTYVDKYNYWIQRSALFGINRNKLIVCVIEQVTAMFDMLNQLRDSMECAHILHTELLPIQDSIKQFVRWDKTAGKTVLCSEVAYQSLVERCKMFTTVELRDMFFMKAKNPLRKEMQQLHENFFAVDEERLVEICRGYIAAFYDGFDVAKRYGDKEYVKEIIDLFYSSISDLGSVLDGSSKRMFKENLWDTHLLIRDTIRPQLFNGITKENWKLADSFMR